MSEEQLKAFLEKVKEDANLQDKIKAAKSHDEVVIIVKGHGHEFASTHRTQLSDKKHEGVSGCASKSGLSGFCVPNLPPDVCETHCLTKTGESC